METFGRGPGGVRRPAPNNPSIEDRPVTVPSSLDCGVNRVETFGRGPGGVRRPAPNNPSIEDRPVTVPSSLD